MRTVLKIFFKSEGASPWITLVCLLSANLAAGIGIATMLPLLTIATQTDSSSPALKMARDFFANAGLPLQVEPLLIIVVVALVLKSVLTYVANCYTGFAVMEVTTRYRKKAIRLFMNSQWQWYVQQPAGRLNHALMGLTGALGSSYRFAAAFVAQTVETAVLIIVALVVSWKVAVVGAFAGIVIAAALDRFVRRSRRVGRKEIIRQRELAVVWGNTSGNFKVLKGMARERAFLRMFEDKLMAWRAAARKQVVNKEARSAFQDVLFAFLAGLGAYLAVVVWGLPIVELIVIFVIINRAVRGIGKLQGFYQQAVAGEYPYIELQAVMSEIREAAEPDRGTIPAEFKTACRFEDVTFSYGKVPVLNSVDLEIPFGEITVITGPSGAGKTTIADLVLGIFRPLEGRITLDGLPLDEISLRSWRRLVGYVAQDPGLYHDTILANIRLGDTSITIEMIEEALRLAEAYDFVAKRPEGINTVLGQGGMRFSGGQRKRIALARAIVRRPRLLILDEVTSALDPENEAIVCHSVRRISRDMAVLAITHRPAFLEIADNVYELNDGTLRRIDAAPLIAAAGGPTVYPVRSGLNK